MIITNSVIFYSPAAVGVYANSFFKGTKQTRESDRDSLVCSYNKIAKAFNTRVFSDH